MPFILPDIMIAGRIKRHQPICLELFKNIGSLENEECRTSVNFENEFA